MFSYFIRRSAQAVAFLFVSSFLLYSLLVIWHPEGADTYYKRALVQKESGGSSFGGYDPNAGVHIVQWSREYYKVDSPWPLNYFLWLFDPHDTQRNEADQEVPAGVDLNLGPLHITGSGILTGDFGESTRFAPGQDVAELIGHRAGRTAWLMLASLLLAIVVAVPLGVLAAARQNSGLDNAITVASIAGLSMPTFLLGLLLIIFLAVLPYQWHHQNGLDWLPYLPPGNVNSLDQENNPLNYLYHLILPATALAAVPIGAISRYVRFSMLEVLGENYIRTAFAKGVGMRRVLLRHTLKNVLLPLITTVALALPAIISAQILVERIFAYPGLGQLFFVASGGTFSAAQGQGDVANRDYAAVMDLPILLILFVLMFTVVAIANTVADLLYAASDPRLSLGSKSGR